MRIQPFFIGAETVWRDIAILLGKPQEIQATHKGLKPEPLSLPPLDPLVVFLEVLFLESLFFPFVPDCGWGGGSLLFPPKQHPVLPFLVILEKGRKKAKKHKDFLCLPNP